MDRSGSEALTMAFVRPTLSEIVNRVQLDFISRLSLVGAVLRRSMVYVLSRVLAGAAHLLHGHLEFLGRQLFPDQSEAEYLVRQASLFGLSKTPPDFAQASALFSGSITGTIIPAGTVLVSASGLTYTVDSDVTLPSHGDVAGAITAVTAGAESTLASGAVLSLQAPIVGVNSTVPIASSYQDGVDEETIEALRVRLLEHMRAPAHGGTAADYIAWAKEVPGVTRVWVEPSGLGPGTVVVRFVRDNDGTGPIPDSGEVATVQAKLDAEKPVHAAVTAIAPIDAPIAFTIHIVPDTSELRAAVTAELRDLLERTSEPAATVLLSSLRTVIGSTTGIDDYTLSVPAANVTHTAGQLPSIGTITWV
jgi:uncharacterized phage protein gp47/JayE